MKTAQSSLRQCVLATSLSALLASCGGGGSGIQSDAATLHSGVLLDSAVSGVHYDDSLTGLDGRFFYFTGDTLRFHLGGIELGTVSGRAQVTPYDLAGSHDDYLYDRATRIARLLQSLDSNGNLADGIQISDATRNLATNASLDWTLSSANFERAAGDLVFDLTSGQGALVSAADARLHLHNTLTSTVESCSVLALNTAQFQIGNARCLDRARMVSWLEDVQPRETALDAALDALGTGGDAMSALDQLVALVPAAVSSATADELEAFAAWVAERIAGDNASLRDLLGEYLGIRYVARVYGETVCADPCSEPTADDVVQSLSAMQQSATANSWRRALAEAHVARSVAQVWLSYGFNRDALLAAYSLDSLRDRTPFLEDVAISLGYASADYRVDVVDAWTASLLGLNDTALALRGSFDGSDATFTDDASGVGVSGVTYDSLIIGNDVTFTVRGSGLGASLELALDGCSAALLGGGSASERVFSCELTGASGWRTVEIRDGLDGSTLHVFSVYVQANEADTVADDDIIEDEPTNDEPLDDTGFALTSVTPTSAELGSVSAFVLRGTGFTSDTAVTLNGCTSLTVTSQNASVIRFSCTPGGTSGNRALVVEQGTVRDNTLRVAFSDAPAVIDSITPTAATQGERQVFTVSGENLHTGLSYSLDGCTGMTVLSGATDTQQRFRCTPADAGALSGSVLDGSTVLHTFSVSAEAAVEPVVTSVSPETGGMLSALEIVVTGTDLPDSLLVELDNCSAMSTVSQSATSQVFSCQPAEAGTQSGNVVVDNAILESFSVEIVDDRITVSEVRPGATRLGAITTFTVSGESLPTSLTLAIEDCDELQALGGSTVRRQFRCTPTGALGERAVEVLSDAASTTPIYTHTMVVAGDGPLVTSVSPTQATVGRTTTFTVVGQSLPTQLSFRMTGCTVSSTGTPTASIHQFRCTLSGNGGERTATVVETQTGTTLYSFKVAVNAAT